MSLKGISFEDRIAERIREDGVKDGHVQLPSGVPMKILIAILTSAAGILIVLLLWQIMGWYVNEFMDITLRFPYPAESIGWVLDSLTEQTMIFGGTIVQHLLGSLKRVGIGFFLAAVLGISLGILIGYCSNHTGRERFGQTRVSVRIVDRP